jgi:uncharacterized membrane protein
MESELNRIRGNGNQAIDRTTRAMPTRGAFTQREQSPLDAGAARRRGLALGWLSLGLGLAQIVAPNQVARWIGLSPTQGTRFAMRAIGVRELCCGIGLLARPRSANWASARLAGDLVDVALLVKAFGSSKIPPRTLAASASVLAIGAVDGGSALASSRKKAAEGVYVHRTITVNRSPEDVYRFWRDFENLPRFMAHLKSVEVVNGRSHWRARGPLNTSIEWDAEMVEDRPNELISWRSVPGADVRNHGLVRFRPAPGSRGTEIVVELRYDPPASTLGATVAKLFGEEPGQQIAGDLRRLKQVMETGEVMASDASVHRGMHAARPSWKIDNQPKRVMT